jgi:hypothetical protein
MKTLKNIFAVLCLLTTSIVTVATSKKPADQMTADQAYYDSLAQQDYYAASNCPQALYQERITVSKGRIQYPTNLSFTDFGLPASEVNLTYSNELSGFIHGLPRSCARSEQIHQGISLIVYSCSENSRLICQVSFERAQ